jgi:hypothetical protein
MTVQDHCPLCGSTRFTQDQINVGGVIPRYVPGLRSCLDCHDGGAPVLLAEVERLRGLLRELEWSGGPHGGDRWCPACKEYEDQGHADCELAAELHP